MEDRAVQYRARPECVDDGADACGGDGHGRRPRSPAQHSNERQGERQNADVDLACQPTPRFGADEIPDVRFGRDRHDGGGLDPERARKSPAVGNELLARKQANERQRNTQSSGHREEGRSTNDRGCPSRADTPRGAAYHEWDECEDLEVDRLQMAPEEAEPDHDREQGASSP